MDEYIVYVCTDVDSTITAVNSSAFMSNTTGWTQIDSGTGDRFMHAQGNYLPNGLTDADGIFNYKLVDGVAVLRTDVDKQLERTIIANAAEITRLKQQLADTDYIAAKIAEGVATVEEYSNKIAERAVWRARINELEVTI